MSEEEDDEEREREMQLESELAALQKEREEILNGENVEFLEEMAEVERVRDSRLAASKDARDYQIWCLQRVFEAEKQAAWDVYSEEKRLARDLMLKVNLERKWRMETLKTGNRKIRLRAMQREKALLETRDATRKNGRDDGILRIALTPDEVNQDLDCIFRGLEQVGRAAPPKRASERFGQYGPPMGIRVFSGSLHVFDQLFERGQLIDVTIKSPASRVSGILRHIGSKGIDVEVSRSRVEKFSLAQLRTGKVLLRRRR